MQHISYGIYHQCHFLKGSQFQFDYVAVELHDCPNMWSTGCLVFGNDSTPNKFHASANFAFITSYKKRRIVKEFSETRIVCIIWFS